MMFAVRMRHTVKTYLRKAIFKRIGAVKLRSDYHFAGYLVCIANLVAFYNSEKSEGSVIRPVVKRENII